MDRETKLSLIYGLIGFLVGCISPTIKTKTMILFGIVILIISGEITDRFIKRKKFGWWLSHGAIPYLSIWFFTWTILINV